MSLVIIKILNFGRNLKLILPFFFPIFTDDLYCTFGYLFANGLFIKLLDMIRLRSIHNQ